MLKSYKIIRTYTRYVNHIADVEVKTETTKNKPSLPALVSMLQFIRHSCDEWLCNEIAVMVKQNLMSKWKTGIDLGLESDGDVMIIYHRMDKIDRTKGVIHDCNFTLLSHADYKRIREKHNGDKRQ